jgi:hypothetical protein
MIATLEKCVQPRITLRIPGPWSTVEDLVEQLPRGWNLKGEWLHPADGPPMSVETMPADGVFPMVFETVLRRPARADELENIRTYRSNAGVTFDGGSLFAAKHLLNATAAIIRAGGWGVFVDNGLISHGGSDWLDLSSACADPMAVFYAYVSYAKLESHIQSHGMHVFGMRDAIISYDGDQETRLRSMEDFLRESCCDGRQWSSGELFRDEDGQNYQLQSVDDRSPFGPGHPVTNPFGRWFLAKKGELS